MKRIRRWTLPQRSLTLSALLLLATLLTLPAVRVRSQTPPPPVNSYTALQIDMFACDVNDSGQVVGEGQIGGAPHAILWQNGVMTDLGGAPSGAKAINNHGQVVGYTWPWEGYNRAVLWDPGSGMQDLGTLGGNESWASDINDAGQVVGTAQNAAGRYRAFLWANGQMTDLGVPDGFAESFAVKINASGQVVGLLTDLAGQQWAFRWTPSGPNATGGAMILLSPTAGSDAGAINGFGDIAGSVLAGDGYSQIPAIWDSAGGVQLLPLLNGAWNGVAGAINDARVVAGYSSVVVAGAGYDYDYRDRAFVWDSSAGTRDLNVLAGQPDPYDLNFAHGINASGQILVSSGSGFYSYLLTPSPLPSRPLGLRATTGSGRVDLSWNASSGAVSYTVKRYTAASGAYVPVATVTGTSWTDTTVTNGTTYAYAVAAGNAYGESAYSDSVWATPAAPPAAPTNLSAAAGRGKHNRQIALTWKQSTSFGVTLNRIYRSTTSGSGYTLRGTLSAGTAFTDTNVSAGITYYYVVTAASGAGESVYSNQASAKVR